ncbi:YibE/F family protein [Candidatus Poribacteria bacterium]|nr:YibE/F family protein [Candidatus Poribacteria bacterium]
MSLKRWQSPIALLVVFVLTHAGYVAVNRRSATISEERDENGNIVAVTEYVKGRVLSVVQSVPTGETNVVELFDVELLGGSFKGERALFRNYLHPQGFPMLNVNAGVGDVILCRVGGSVGEVRILSARNLVQDYSRDGFIVALLGILIAVVIIVGRGTGIRAAVTMVLNGVILYYVMLPMIHRGFDPVWTIVLTCALISVQSRLIVAGFGRKTYAAILGTIGGVLIAGVVVLFAQSELRFTGIERANAVDIIESQSASYLDFAGLLIAGMLIGLLGIANDAAIEVASAMEEVSSANPGLGIPRLIEAGMNVGTDILGTMVNTVIFVYFGLRLLVVLAVVGTDVIPATGMEILSLGAIASEIVRIIAGTIGLVVTIPLTAAISGGFHALARRRAVA